MSLSSLAPLWLLAAGLASPDLGGGEGTALAPGEVDAIELSWARARALREAAADDAGASAPGPWAAERELDLRPVEGGFVLEGRWTIVAESSGWLAGELLGPGLELRRATLDGERAPVVALPGRTLLVAWIEGGRGKRVELRVRAFVPGGLDDRLALGLLPATRGRLRAAVAGRVPVPVHDDAEGPPAAAEALPTRVEGGVVWSGASRLVMRLHDPAGAPPPARDVLAVAHVGVGLTVGDAEVRGRAHVQWELRQGELSRVRATLAGVGDDLTVEGPGVATWARNGDALDVELSAPATGRVDLELRWTQAIGSGEETRVPLPRIEPEAWRSESSLQLARDGELEVIPEVEEGTAIAAAALPEWGRGLVEGTPTAAYQHGSGASTGHLDLLRFVPVPGPPTVVDVADATIATTDEGRVLMKVRYDVRNDRAAHLSVRPPPGLRIVGARVGVETALPAQGDDGAWRIPLRRSLETVDGLLSFPVEVILLGEQPPWGRRERRELPLPTLDAPIAASRITLFLPPRYRSRLEPGERNVVDAFDEGEGLAYGKGVSSDRAAVADALLEEAVQGYLSNDFEAAQEKLDELEALGIESANVARLRSNIDVIEGKSAGADKGDVTLQRRVKEQAKARASEDFRRQEELIAEAEQAAQAGDYAQAESRYQAALDLGGKLAKLEQAESVEQAVVNTSVRTKLGSVSEKKKSRKAAGRSWKKAATYRDPSAGIMDLGEGQGSSAPSVTAAVEPEEEERLAAAAHDTPAADPMVTADPAQALAGQRGPADGEIDRDRDALPDAVDAAPATDEPHERAYQPEPDLADDAPRLLADTAAPMRRPARVGRKRADERAPLGRARGRLVGRRGGEKPLAVYEFANDSLDGAALTPDGAPMLASRDAPLPAPQVTASALSVIVPVTGQAVRYQQLLIEANQTQVVEIHARRRLRR